MGKKHKHFLSKERFKKLRMLIHHLAEQERNKQQEERNKEDQRIIAERVGQPKNMDGMEGYDLIDLIKAYHERVYFIESQKWDLEYNLRKSDMLIDEINIQVNDLRGKFIKPGLKKVPHCDKTMSKFQAKTGDFNFKSKLKHVAMV